MQSHWKSRLLAVFVLLLFGTRLASADTYAIVMNTLDKPITINGSEVIRGGDGVWTPLDANIIYNGNKSAKIRDMKRNCTAASGNSGWLLTGSASLNSNYCIELGFAEIGCILAVLHAPNPNTPQNVMITMTKMAGSNCSNSWWNTKGKGMAYEAYDLYKEQVARTQDGARALAELISAIK